MPLSSILKPEYLFRPKQVIARLRPPRGHDVRLPWGHIISCDPREDLGRAIHALGVYDLAVTETLWRLTDPEDVAVDAGANIGYMTALLSARAARVLSFEPHPEIFKKLATNAVRWSEAIELHECALSDTEGAAKLALPETFAENKGVAFISDSGEVEIRMRRLDALSARVDVLKIDVEGHELAVLKGAGDLVGRIRDIIFEEHGKFPTPATDYLRSHGYDLFAVGQSFFRPLLLAPGSRPGRYWLPLSYLATIDPARALSRFRGPGWRSLA